MTQHLLLYDKSSTVSLKACRLARPSCLQQQMLSRLCCQSLLPRERPGHRRLASSWQRVVTLTHAQGKEVVEANNMGVDLTCILQCMSNRGAHAAAHATVCFASGYWNVWETSQELLRPQRRHSRVSRQAACLRKLQLLSLTLRSQPTF